MPLVWFVAKNVWAGTLILAAALDLARQHAPAAGKPRARTAED